MLSNNEIKRIEEEKQIDKLAQKGSDKDKIEADAGTEREKNLESSARFVNKVIILTIILGIAVSIFLILGFQKLG